MPLYKPTELIAFLQSLGVAPKKTLSQNFLIDGNVIRNIVKLGGILPNDEILEIGPGPGALTEALLQAEAHVLAIETDNTLANALNRFSGPLKILCDDALQVPLEKIFSYFPEGKKIKIFGNLPYHIAVALINRFVTLHNKIECIVIMVQEEVARRMCAKPKSPEYGSLSIYLNFYADVTYGFKVSRNCFFPAPKIDSAIVRLNLKSPPAIDDPDHFFSTLRSAFMHRRKVLRNSLKNEYGVEKIEDALQKLNLSVLTRPEELSLEEWLEFYRLLKK